jgi:NAD(P)-dependent dehydrogenase (short-subunit alcohol dehydrogenase family)
MRIHRGDYTCIAFPIRSYDMSANATGGGLGRLTDKVAIVTGAGRGIGEAVARALAAESAKVVIADISGDQEKVAESLGEDALAVQVDMSDSDSVAALMEATVDRFDRLDVLCNNAGIEGDITPVTEYSPETFDRVIAVNLRGVFLGIRHGARAMLETAGGGSIINTSSVAALRATPGAVAYNTAKAGVLGLTRGAAADLSKSGVRVNAICPGIIETPMFQNLVESHPEMHAQIKSLAESTAMGRTGSASEIGSATVFLASDDSSFITGATIPVDGGYTS